MVPKPVDSGTLHKWPLTVRPQPTQIPSALAHSLDMPESLLLQIRLKKGVPIAARVDVEPLGPDDWEVRGPKPLTPHSMPPVTPKKPL